MRKFVQRPAILIWKDQRGSIAVITAVCLIVLTGVLGFAIDAGSWEVARRGMQGAADAAAYSAAWAYKDATTNNIVTQAEGITAAQGYVAGASGVTVSVEQWPNFLFKPVTYPPSSKAIEVIVTQPQPTIFSGLYQATAPTVSARAVANTPAITGPGCVLALNNNGANGGTISINGNGVLTATSCDVAANSTSGSAIKTNGSHATITAPDCTVAGATPTTIAGCAKVTDNATTVDPYAGVAFPAFPACVPWIAPPAPQAGKCYSGNITLTSSLNFPSGNYYFTGSLSFAGPPGTTFTNSSGGVTFFIKTPGFVSATGNSVLKFAAPTDNTNPYAGIVFFGDPAGTAAITNDIAGNSNGTMTGVLYFPTEALQYAGNGASGTGCTEIIADVITITGNGTFHSGCSGTKTINVDDGTGPIAIVE
jgi:hypothetical protein